MATRVPDGLTFRISSNTRDKTTRILAYRRGGFKRAYKAIIPMCGDDGCRKTGPQTTPPSKHKESCRRYHQADVNALVQKLIKSYS